MSGAFSADASARSLRLLALGDSLTAGYLLAERDAFPAQLEKSLRAKGLDVAVVNAGVSGDTATAELERLDWALTDDFDGAIVEAGANDMLRGIDPAITKAALSGILAKLKERHIPVLLAGMVAAPGMGRAYEEAFNAIYPQVAREFEAPLYPFFLDGVAGNPALQLSDGMHPNQEGVRRMVQGILPFVLKLITDGRPAN